MTRAPTGSVRFHELCWAEKVAFLYFSKNILPVWNDMPRSVAWAMVSTAIRRMAEMLALRRLSVDLTGWDVVAHTVNLVVGKPQLTGSGMGNMPDGVAHATGMDLAPAAALVELRMLLCARNI